jgi:hypothetical protein
VTSADLDKYQKNYDERNASARVRTVFSIEDDMEFTLSGDIRVCLCCASDDAKRAWFEAAITLFLERHPGKTAQIHFCDGGDARDFGTEYYKALVYPEMFDMMVSVTGMAQLTSASDLLRDGKRHVSAETQAQQIFFEAELPVTKSGVQPTGKKTINTVVYDKYSWGLARLPDAVAAAHNIPELPVSVADAAALKAWLDANIPAGKYLMSIPKTVPILFNAWVKEDGTANNWDWFAGFISIMSVGILGASEHDMQWSGRKPMETTVFDVLVDIKHKLKFVDSADEIYKDWVAGTSYYAPSNSGMGAFTYAQQERNFYGLHSWDNSTGKFDLSGMYANGTSLLDKFDDGETFRAFPYFEAVADGPQIQQTENGFFLTRTAPPERKPLLDEFINFLAGEEVADLAYEKLDAFVTHKAAAARHAADNKFKAHKLSELQHINRATGTGQWLDILVSSSKAKPMENLVTNFFRDINTPGIAQTTVDAINAILAQDSTGSSGNVSKAP